jgi:hypothetical protein
MEPVERLTQELVDRNGGQERGYEWTGRFKFRDYGARKAAEQA